MKQTILYSIVSAVIFSVAGVVGAADRGCGGNPSCTLVDIVPDDGVIVLELDPAPGCSSVYFTLVTASNATPADVASANAAIDYGTNPYTLTISQVAPGPVSWEGVIQNDGGGQATCGPFTNDDGLPVALVTFTVE